MDCLNVKKKIIKNFSSLNSIYYYYYYGNLNLDDQGSEKKTRKPEQEKKLKSMSRLNTHTRHTDTKVNTKKNDIYNQKMTTTMTDNR